MLSGPLQSVSEKFPEDLTPSQLHNWRSLWEKCWGMHPASLDCRFVGDENVKLHTAWDLGLPVHLPIPWERLQQLPPNVIPTILSFCPPKTYAELLEENGDLQDEVTGLRAVVTELKAEVTELRAVVTELRQRDALNDVPLHIRNFAVALDDVPQGGAK